MYFKAAEEMGQSNIIKFLIKYSVPSIISGLVSTGDNPVDDHFVAQFGAPALAALAAANPLMIIRNAVGGGPGLAPPQSSEVTGARKTTKWRIKPMATPLPLSSSCRYFHDGFPHHS